MYIPTHHDVPLEQLSWLEHKVELLCLGCINMAEMDINTHYWLYFILKHPAMFRDYHVL